MNRVLARLAALFIAPPERESGRDHGRSSPPPAGSGVEGSSPGASLRDGARSTASPASATSLGQPATAALLATAADVAIAAGDLASELRRRGRAPAAIVCVWPAPETSPAGTVVLPAARGLMTRMAARGHDARGSGALCVIHLPAAPQEAAAAASRILGAVPAPTPSVLALAKRDPAFDALLADVDLLAVSRREDDPAGLADLAAAALANLGPPVAIRATPTAPLARRCAAFGISRPPAASAEAARPVRAFGAPKPPAGAAADASPVATAFAARRAADSSGQAVLLVVGVLCALLVGAFVLGGVARGIGVRSDAQRAADIAALAGARAMDGAYPRLFEPAVIGGRANPAHLEKAAYLELGRKVAIEAAARNGAARARVVFPDGTTIAPVRIRVTVTRRVEVRRGEAQDATTVAATAEAELAPTTSDGLPAFAAGGGYSGPLEYRQGKPMRPDVARAFDRMAAAARAAGVHLLITSAFRSDAEQAVLWARNPDPRWVAPPGKSLHRYGTELDLGPPAAYGWLAGNAPRFHFVKRYAWEAWHFGYSLNAASSPTRRTGSAARHGAAGDGHADGLHRAVPSFVPPAFAEPIADAAQRWNVSATLLAAQLYAESGFNPFAVSPAGARGIAQFMPATARAYGLRNPFDAARAIEAQARMMRDLLREFAAVPLALAAYNAGPARVRACGCVPPIAETRGYVARILGLMGGAGETPTGADATLAVRLVA